MTKDEFLPYYESAHAAALQNVHLKGFRPGTAPKELADAAVDKEKIFEEAAEEAVRQTLDEISQKNNWVIIDKPQVTADEHQMGLKYSATLTVFPEIKLGNYRKIAKRIFSASAAAIKAIKIEPGEVDKAVEWVRESRKPRRTDNIQNNEVGAPIGASEKDDKLPELNDEFARSLGKFKDVADFRNSISDGLHMEKEFRERDKARIKVLEEIIKDSQIDVPDIMIEKTLNQMAGNNEEQRGKLREKARENVLANLVLYKIAEEEKISFEPEKGVDNFKVFEHLEGLAAK